MQARAAKAVNVALTLRNWLIGGLITHYNLRGEDRALYGDKTVAQLSKKLRDSGIRHAHRRDLYRYCDFFRAYPKIVETLSPQLHELLSFLPNTTRRVIVETASPQSECSAENVATASPQSQAAPIVRSAPGQLQTPGEILVERLSYSHLELLAPIAPPLKRTFYEIEAIKGSWLCRTRDFVDLCLRASEGTTNRVRLKENRFLALEIPLPPLAEQRRIVARIEALAAEIAEAKRLRQEAVEEAEAMGRAIITQNADSIPTPMSELVRMRASDVAVQSGKIYQFAGVYCFGRGVFRSVTKTGIEFAYPRLTRLKTGDFVYPKLMAWEGALSVVPEKCDGLVVSTEFPVFEVQTDRVHPEVLDIHFKNPAVWPELSGSSTGTNVRRRRLNPSDFLNYKFPLPPRPIQETLRKIMAEVNAMNRLQADTAAELDAMVPAILDRAFEEEL